MEEKKYHVSELGLDGLTWNWNNMELNKKYYFEEEDIIETLFFIDNELIVLRAKELNANAFITKLGTQWILELNEKTYDD